MPDSSTTTATLVDAPPSNDLLAAALAYAAKGWRVIHVHTPQPDGGCSCLGEPCESPGKHPRVHRWPEQATTDPAMLARIWTCWPDANVGLVLGDGLIDIECDPRHGGDESMRLLEQRLGGLPDTVTWISGGGGEHRLFRVPLDARIPSNANIGRDILGVPPKGVTGVDVRSQGGFAVAPPSRHESGNCYRFGNLHPDAIDVADLPSSWLEYLNRPSRAEPAATAVRVDGSPIPDGARNETMTRIAGHLRRGGLSEFEMLPALETINDLRCQPPLEEAEVAKIARSIGRYPPDQVTVAVIENWAATTLAASRAAALTPQQLLAYETGIDPNTLLGRRWLCRSGACLLVGQTGIGKSSFAMQAAVTWGLGLPLFGIAPARPLRSLIIQAENDTGDLAEMFQGVISGLGCQDALPELDRHLRLVTECGICGPAFHAYAKGLIAEHKPDLVWIDPLFAYLGGSASEQEVVSAFLRNGLGAIAQETGVAWMLVHHTNKPVKDAKPSAVASDYAYLGAGSAELANWARSVLVLRDVGGDAFELRAAKRGRRSGLVDAAGQPCSEIFLRHGGTGICWERAERPDQDRGADDRLLAQDVLATMAADRAYSRQDLRDLVQEILGVSKSAVLTTGRRANRVYRMALDLTRLPDDPERHRKPAPEAGHG